MNACACVVPLWQACKKDVTINLAISGTQLIKTYKYYSCGICTNPCNFLKVVSMSANSPVFTMYFFHNLFLLEENTFQEVLRPVTSSP